MVQQRSHQKTQRWVQTHLGICTWTSVGPFARSERLTAVEVRCMQLAGREAVHLIPESLNEAGIVESESPGILQQLVYRA